MIPPPADTIATRRFLVGSLSAANIGGNPAYPLQSPASIAYTRKDFSGHWGYRPPE